MQEQPFAGLVDGSEPLLREVERLVVDAHRRWYRRQGGRDWLPPLAYHWLHYEDADPVRRLIEGATRLARTVEVDRSGLERVIRLGSQLGYRESPEVAQPR